MNDDNPADAMTKDNPNKPSNSYAADYVLILAARSTIYGKQIQPRIAGITGPLGVRRGLD